MAKSDTKESIKAVCSAAIRGIKNNHSYLEAFIENNYLGKEFGQLAQPIKVKDKERFKKDVCFGLIGKKISTHWEGPRNFLEDVWAVYTESRKQEYENSLYLATLDRDLAHTSATRQFEKTGILAAIREKNIIESSLSKTPNSDPLEKITDTQLKEYIRERFYGDRDNVQDAHHKNLELLPGVPWDNIFQHDFIYRNGIFDTPDALVERTILIRSALLLYGINPFSKKGSEASNQAKYANEHPIKACIYSLQLLAARFRQAEYPHAQQYWGASSDEFRLYRDCVTGGLNYLIDRLENYSRLKNYDGKDDEFKESINMVILASLRDITPAAMSQEVREDNNTRMLLGLDPKEETQKRLNAELEEENKLLREDDQKKRKNESFKKFKYENVAQYLKNHPKTKSIIYPNNIEVLEDRRRDLDITDIF